MSIHEQENALFAQWRSYLNAHNQHFIADGVVNEEEWKAAPRKTVFLLKETNSENYEWDERDYLNKYYSAGYHPAVVSKLAQWVDAVVLEREPKDWISVEGRTASLEAKTALLRRVCWVNVKKTAGKGSVEQESYEEYWSHQENRDFLKAQLALYSPDFIICCGTFDEYLDLYPELKDHTQMTSRGLSFCLHGSIPVINHYHPGAFVKNYLLHYSLYDAIHEVMPTHSS